MKGWVRSSATLAFVTGLAGAVPAFAQCPPVYEPAFYWLSNQSAMQQYFDAPANVDIVIAFLTEAEDDVGQKVRGVIQAAAFSRPDDSAGHKPKAWARFSFVDVILGGESADQLSILANRLDGHHFGWYQKIAGASLPDPGGIKLPDETFGYPPGLIDPQPGGYGDSDWTPTINDAFAADALPWYFNHGACNLSLFTGSQPLNSGPVWRSFKTENEFWFEDSPGLPNRSYLDFETWLVLLNADGSLNKPLPGFSWTFTHDNLGEEVVQITGKLDPFSVAGFDYAVAQQGYAVSAPPVEGPINGDFIQADPGGDGAAYWDSQGAGDSEVVQDIAAADSFAVELSAGSPITISQTIATPSSPFDLVLSLLFESAQGSLVIELDGQVVETVDGFAPAGVDYEERIVAVTEAGLLNRNALLEITYDGPSGSWVRLDGLSYSTVPEPSAMALAIAALATIARAAAARHCQRIATAAKAAQRRPARGVRVVRAGHRRRSSNTGRAA